jgi:hypothetical protein
VTVVHLHRGGVRHRTLAIAVVAMALLLAGCANREERTYEEINYINNLVGDATGLTHVFLATNRTGFNSDQDRFSWYRRTPAGWVDVLEQPDSGAHGFTELRADDAGRIGFCGAPNFVGRDIGTGVQFATLTNLPEQWFICVEPLGGGRFVFTGEHGRLVDWDADYRLRSVGHDSTLTGAWLGEAGALHVSSWDGFIFREEGAGWVEVLSAPGVHLGRSIAEPGGGRYFTSGVDGIRKLQGNELIALHDVAVRSWDRPFSLGGGVFGIVGADDQKLIGFDATRWWVEAEFPGMVIRDAWCDPGGVIYVALSTPGNDLSKTQASLLNRKGGLWREIDIHGFFGIPAATAEAAADKSLLAPTPGGLP